MLARKCLPERSDTKTGFTYINMEHVTMIRRKCNTQYGRISPCILNKGQSLIGKVIAPLQLPLEIPVSVETVHVLRHVLRIFFSFWLCLF